MHGRVGDYISCLIMTLDRGLFFFCYLYDPLSFLSRHVIIFDSLPSVPTEHRQEIMLFFSTA